MEYCSEYSSTRVYEIEVAGGSRGTQNRTGYLLTEALMYAGCCQVLKAIMANFTEWHGAGMLHTTGGPRITHNTIPSRYGIRECSV